MNVLSKTADAYWNPYLSGIGLGLVLLATFVVMGRGLGASGAMTSVVAVGVESVAPEHAQSSDFYTGYLNNGSYHPLKDWLVFEVIGLILGGLASGYFAGRLKRKVEKGPRISSSSRFLFALGGGAVMGFGSKLARGCTSGQALTGGALLNVGSWAFMIALFAGAYVTAYFVRRLWT